MSEQRRKGGITFVTTLFVVGIFVGLPILAYLFSDIIRDIVDDWSKDTTLEDLIDVIENFVDPI